MLVAAAGIGASALGLGGGVVGASSKGAASSSSSSRRLELSEAVDDVDD